MNQPHASHRGLFDQLFGRGITNADAVQLCMLFVLIEPSTCYDVVDGSGAKVARGCCKQLEAQHCRVPSRQG